MAGQMDRYHVLVGRLLGVVVGGWYSPINAIPTGFTTALPTIVPHVDKAGEFTTTSVRTGY